MNDPEQVRSNDARLAGTPLLDYDLRFASQWFSIPGRLLDLGCGTGRLLIPFAQRGFAAVGVDLSDEMLHVAAEKARQAGVAVSLLRANLVELDALRSETFDYAACLFSTLGMIEGREHRQTALSHFFRVLKPGGRLLLHVHTPGFHSWTRTGRRWLLRDFLRRLLRADDCGDYTGPAGVTLHHFRRGETVRDLRRAGFRILDLEPVSLRPDSQLPLSWWFASVRAYGYLIAAERR
jgi:ubiquinone/menaquinone biosynthesis C-methylase UbiE